MTPRTLYCSNLNPVFAEPSKHNPRPSFNQRLKEYLSKHRLALWPGFRALPALNPKTLALLPRRQRCFNPHRAKAMQAMAIAIAHHMNITTGVVYCSVEKLSDLCGLSTVSANGNRSITRASRVIQLFEEYGLLQCEREWDSVLGIWYPKLMTVTTLFMQMAGSNEKEWQAAIRQQNAYRKSDLLLPGEEQLEPSEAVERLKARMKALYLKHRHERHEKKRALKLLRKSRDEQRHELCKKITKTLPTEKIALLGLEGVQKLINRRLSELKNFVGFSPTT